MASRPTSTTARWLPWLVRAAWLSLPATTGEVVGLALDGRSAAVVTVAAACAWVGWAAGVVALLLPRPVGAVVVRLVGPAAVVATAWAAVAADLSPLAAAGWVAAAAVPALAVLAPATGEWLVNGAAYGHERRYLLRVPGPLALGPVPIAAVAAVAGLVAGPLLLAAQQWMAGGVALVAGWAVAVVATRALAGLTTRWVVLVPAGLVVKDHTILRDPALFRREDIARFGPAPADTDATDLTGGAFGLALELRLVRPYGVSRTSTDTSRSEVELAALLITPTRPAALVADAAARRIAT